MIERFAKLPRSLAERARTVRLSPDRVRGAVGGVEPGIPALMAHPDWITPVPTVIWLHGRTAYKEMDSGRYLRWIKAGMAGVAIDLPGHGERKDKRAESAAHSLDVLAELVAEIDLVVEALADPIWQGVFDLDRLAIGGMSMGGMATLRRLCDAHEFRCAAVEATTGDLGRLYAEDGPRPWGTWYSPEKIAPLDPAQHLGGFRPIPLLSLHSEADRIVPATIQRGFIGRLRAHYVERGADSAAVEYVTWPETGAPEEHIGFGRFSSDAKNAQTEFLRRVLLEGKAG